MNRYLCYTTYDDTVLNRSASASKHAHDDDDNGDDGNVQQPTQEQQSQGMDEIGCALQCFARAFSN
jgi:hypothetical protein